MLLNYTLNKVSTISSYEVVYGKAPPIADLHPFGYRALWLDPSENKLESRALEGVYVGVAGGGYYIFNPITKRAITRRDVRFVDNEFPLINTAVLAASISPRREAFNALNGLNANN